MAVIDNQLLGKLRNIAAFLAHCFVEREELIKLLLLSWISRENLLIVGPTGSAKSELAHTASACLHGRFFEILLTRFTEPQELFGPLNVQAFSTRKVLPYRRRQITRSGYRLFRRNFQCQQRYPQYSAERTQ